MSRCARTAALLISQVGLLRRRVGVSSSSMHESLVKLLVRPMNMVILGSPKLGWSKRFEGGAMSLTSEQARAVSACVREHAAGLGARITVAIVDGGGHVLVVDRMDGAPPLSARIAPAKASSVALFHRDGGELVRLQQAWPALFAQLDQVAGTPIIAGAGSRLIRRGDVVVGAIAVSGSAPEHDDACAEIGLVSARSAVSD
ncbi:heme-binding protein [Nocardia sp. NPDC047038]|uniref:GlcG/HbpS family heme-binding protein n=1 Tax=Nocardia sp. NPDC047038 TaxID=3154338 RepID=UPI00340DC838